MTVITPANEDIMFALGKQTIAPGTTLRPNRYMLATDVPEGLLVWNTLTLSMALVENVHNIESLAADASNLGELTEGWFLVPEDFDEGAVFEELKTISKACEPATRRSEYTILTTTACNARCHYCYEAAAGIKPESIDEPMARRIVEFIAKREAVADDENGNEVLLRWFGGEPLVNRRAIDMICGMLSERGITYRSTITTNGFLFTPDLIATAVEKWNLRRVQITLDGTDEVYCRIKNYIGNPAAPLRRVLRSIHLLSEAGIRVNIRLNMDLDNVDDLINLTRRLGEEFKGDKRVRVYPAIIFETLDAPDSEDSAELKQLLDRFRELREAIRQSGLATAPALNKQYRIRACMADNPQAFTITPTGNLTRCEHYCDTEIVGNITDEITDRELYDEWGTLNKGEKCAACALNPVCAIVKKCPGAGACTPGRRGKQFIEKEAAMIGVLRRKRHNKAGEPGI